MPAILAQLERTEEAGESLQNGDASRCGRITPPPIAHLATKKKLIPFGWYGGKFSHLDWLLPLLPPCHHYCEPFAGSGAVLLNRDPSPVETFNDLDGEVVNFFRVLREDKERLVESIGLTPFAREEVLRPRPASAHGSGADSQHWPLGQLQKHQSRRHERGHQPLAGRGARFAGGGRAAASRANRKSSSQQRHPPLRFFLHAFLLRSALCPLDARGLESLRI
jgi:hypothetical protein